MNKLKILQVVLPGLFTPLKTETGQLKGFEGDLYELLKILAQRLKFDYELIIQEEINWGVRQCNGNWTGNLGMFQRREINISTVMIQASDRLEVVDLSPAHTFTDVSFAIKKADFASKTFIYFSPFQRTLWAVAILTVCFCILCTLIFQRYTESARRLHLSDSAYFSVELISRNYNIHRKNLYTKISTRLFLGCCILGLMVLRFGYTSTLLAFLMEPIMEPQISTFDQLAKACREERILVTTRKGSTTYENMIHSEIDSHKDIGVNMQNHPEVMLTKFGDSVSAVDKGFAVLYSRDILKTLFVGNEHVFLSPDSAFTIQICLAYRKGFCCAKEFDDIMQRITETGIYQKIVQDAVFRRSLKGRITKDKEKIRPLSIPDVIGILYLLGPCYLIGILCFIIEHSIGRKSKDNPKNGSI